MYLNIYFGIKERFDWANYIDYDHCLGQVYDTSEANLSYLNIYIKIHFINCKKFVQIQYPGITICQKNMTKSE